MKRETLRAACCIGTALVLTACGSNWRMRTEETVLPQRVHVDNAPTWVRGSTPTDTSRVYFVGRALVPDRPMWPVTSSSGYPPEGETPDARVGYTLFDESRAVTAARRDVAQQVRETFAPCTLCCPDPWPTGPGVAPVSGSAACPQPAPQGDACGSTPCGKQKVVSLKVAGPPNACGSVASWYSPSTLSACDAAVPCGTVQVVSAGGGCGGGAKAGCDSHAVSGWLNAPQTGVAAPCGRCDVCAANPLVKPDTARLCATSVIDAIASERRGRVSDRNAAWLDTVVQMVTMNLRQEDIYWEHWNAHERDDESGRPFAEGRDEWQSYKCWVLYSIPVSEYERLVAQAENWRVSIYTEETKAIANDEAALAANLSTRYGKMMDAYDQAQLRALQENVEANAARAHTAVGAYGRALEPWGAHRTVTPVGRAH